MSCIKFPTSKSDLAVSKSSSKEADYAAITNNLISKANQLFGERNWSHVISSQTLDFIDYAHGKYQAGGVSIVRIQLKDGIFHEDLGYNSSEGSSKGSAIQRVRLGSYNTALKKVLTYFENDTLNREMKSLSRSNSPVPTESAPKNLTIEVNQTTTVPSVSNKIDSDQFEDIPMSQTDALMDIVDLDQLCGKDQNLNVVTATKADLSKPNISKGNDLLIRNTNGFKDIKDVPKLLAATVASSAITVPTLKKEAKVDAQKIVATSTLNPEIFKPVVYTVMTEEEMRQERKRKQREMQEEFKRKEEIKRKHVDNGNVPKRNPRY